jgi:hypothetical protein
VKKITRQKKWYVIVVESTVTWDRIQIGDGQRFSAMGLVRAMLLFEERIHGKISALGDLEFRSNSGSTIRINEC